MNFDQRLIECRAEVQYLDALERIYRDGTDIHNPRTGHFCRTVINVDLEYDASTTKAPIVTSRKANPKLAIAEILGYVRGVTSAAEMRELGSKSWDANANENEAWLKNPNRKGTDDLGLIYGAVAKNWPHAPGKNGVGGISLYRGIDLFDKVYQNLKAGKDDRGEIITFWNPGMFHLGCLRPCMYEHQFSLVGDDLYLNSTQRSSDWALGTVANMVQVWLLLRLMAQITGKNPKVAYHRNVNAHLYDNQLPLVEEQLSRRYELYAEPEIAINPDIKTLDDLRRATLDDFVIHYPDSHPPIKYPFAV